MIKTFIGGVIFTLVSIACAGEFIETSDAASNDASGPDCTEYAARFPAASFAGTGGSVYDAITHRWTGLSGAVLVAPMMPEVPKNAYVELLGYSFTGEGFYSIAIKSISMSSGKVKTEAESRSSGVGLSQARKTFRSPMTISNRLLYTVEAKIADKKGGLTGGVVNLRICHPAPR